MIKLSTGIIHRLCATPNSTLKVAMYLRGSIRSMLVGEPLRRIARKRCLVLLAGLCVVFTTPASATQAEAVSTIEHRYRVQCINPGSGRFSDHGHGTSVTLPECELPHSGCPGVVGGRLRWGSGGWPHCPSLSHGLPSARATAAWAPSGCRHATQADAPSGLGALCQ